MKFFVFVCAIAVATIISVAATPQEISAPEIVIVPQTKAAEVDRRAEKIDAYFSARSMPLAGYGTMFVQAADKHGIEWNLLPSISVAESSGGKRMCKNNPFGWASCKVQFDSLEEAIEYVSQNLGGNNPRTARYYSGDSESDLWSYNGTVDPTYPGRVMKIMQDIASTPLPH